MKCNKFKFFIAAVAAVAATAAPLALAACADGAESEDGENFTPPPEQIVTTYPNDANGDDYVFYVTQDVLEIQLSTSAYDYLDALRADGLIEFESYQSAYGQYIKSVGGLQESYIDATSMYYWAVFADFVTIDGVTYCDDSTTVNYGGTTFYYSTYGASGLPAFEGHSYALVYYYTSW